jgi:hypothetical protein
MPVEAITSKHCYRTLHEHEHGQSYPLLSRHRSHGNRMECKWNTAGPNLAAFAYNGWKAGRFFSSTYSIGMFSSVRITRKRRRTESSATPSISMISFIVIHVRYLCGRFC